ncbi:Cancer susceptibility candidate 1, N-terminal,Cancer susceptibility candidate protein 1,Casc1 [Cinara cedri]|uniref:Cancer susceptibility candidate 1, N-terminal,Cancer susceptibility candidate protein 1,Casc1 n=1 Tax=Cinara cedri TaxID=506608 RepID=A0A5E4MZV4_9HEMI|nr:Cancer susceptibility candidate 1, N-terminal,Cancer susceptibility candidate protein 1,Casc1 [Cinara cedri]
MAKRIDKRKKQLKSNTSKLYPQTQEIEKSRLKALQAQNSEKLTILEQQTREQQLKHTCAMLSELSRKKYEHDRMYRDELDWKHWIQCDGTPNPLVVQDINTYLFVERQVTYTNDDQNTYVNKCLEIFNIMDAVDDIVDLPLDFNQFKLQCFREARDNLGRLLVEIVHGVCYHLLSDYDHRMIPVDLKTVEYKNSCEAFAVGLHVVCHRPRLKTDNTPSPKCDFPECLVMVEVPPQLSQHYIAIMALWLRWDPFTDRMTEFDVSKSPELDTRDLWQYWEDTWAERNQILEEPNKEKERAEKEQWLAEMENKLKLFAAVDRVHYPEDLKAYIEELEANEPGDIIDIIQSEHSDEADEESPSQILEKKKPEPLEQTENISNALKYPEKPNELNPRRYWIIGGAFNVEMWKLPMQPVEHRNGALSVMIIGPSMLQPIDYHEKYEPLQLSMGFSSTSSEDEETDVKKQNQEALKRLALINIKLPENVLWFENPKPAMWNEDRKVWTTDYIYDIRFNEEKQMVSFRAGRMGSFGLAVNRYSNFPFQSWEVRPEGGANEGGVVLSVTAATVLVEFVVRGDHVAMVQLQNATTVALQEMIGAYHRPDRLIRLLRRGGVNLFPAPDARHYVDSHRPPKQAVTERHTYRCMAALSSTHQFTASRWNVNVPADRIIFQMKEIPVDESGSSGDTSVGAGVGTPYKMVMVTPERAVLLKCSEASQAFSEESQSASFTPDLFALATEVTEVTSSDQVRTSLTNVDVSKTMETLFYLMDKIKFFSYS